MIVNESDQNNISNEVTNAKKLNQDSIFYFDNKDEKTIMSTKIESYFNEIVSTTRTYCKQKIGKKQIYSKPEVLFEIKTERCTGT